MTREEIISGLQMTMDLIQFDPGTGNVRPIYTLNNLDKATYVACKEAIEALKAQGTCEDAVSRQTLQKELALYPIDDVTTEDEAGYNRAINDVQKMVLHLPSAQPEPLSDAYTKAVWTWLLDYQIKVAELKGRYAPYEVLSWVANDWRREHE